MTNSPPPALQLNRPMVGLIAVACGIAAIVLIWFPDQSALQGACSRVGMVMAALWFALPKSGQSLKLERLVAVFVATVILIVLSRKLILVMLPLILVIGVLLTILRPKSPDRPTRI